jgi:hypothetical protein
MNKPAQEEYRALRATIRERGTVRVITFVATIAAWAALELAFAAAGPRDVVGAFLSLLMLAAGFEAIYQVHIGVERVGRYLQVFYEEASPPQTSEPAHGAAAVGGVPGWETAAMAYGQRYPGAGSDPLFGALFMLATFVNLLPVLRAWRFPGLFAAIALPHLAFLVRVRVAVARAAAQRAQDLARFRALAGRETVEPPADTEAPSA